MRDVLTFGEALAGFYPASGETLTRFVAGAELNLAVHLARLERSVTYVTRVGDDPFGVAVCEALAAQRIDARVAVDPERRTGIYFRELGGAGPRRVYYYRAGSAASELRPDDLPPLGGYRIVHATGVTAALGPSCLAAVEHAAGAAFFSLDVNFRPALWSAELCREALLPLAARAAVVFLSDDDNAALTPAEALDAGAAAVIHMRGAGGALYLGQDGTRLEAQAPVVEAVDTVGAGDAFAAGFLHAQLAGAGPLVSLEEGCRLGAQTVARVGDSL